MGLELGLESLNNTPSRVVPFSVESLLDMGELRLASESLLTQLDNYYAAAVNAMTVRKSVKKFGKTQATVYLVGQEALSSAMSFSMEGFWQKTKEFLIKIWEKIKEWWGRFWGMFFSAEKKLESFVNDVGGKNLAHPCEVDGPVASAIKSQLDKYYDSAIKQIQNAVNATSIDAIDTVLSAMGNYDSSSGDFYKAFEVAFTQKHQTFKTGDEVKAQASTLLEVLKTCAKRKKDIDEYTKKAVDAVKKVTATGDDAGKIDKLLNALKKAAKLNNKFVSKLSNEATSLAIKIMAHTRIAA